MAKKKVVIDMGSFHEEPKQKMQAYEANFVNELSKIADIANKYLPDDQKISKTAITDRNRWTMKHVLPSSERSDTPVTLRVPGKEDVTKGKMFQVEGNESLFDFLKSKIDDAKKNAPKSEKKDLKDLKGYVDLLQLQAMTKISEEAAKNSLENFTDKLPKIEEKISKGRNPTQKAEMTKLFRNMEHSSEILKVAYDKFSLDFLENGKLERYTSNDAGDLRAVVKEHTDSIKKTLNHYEKAGIITKAEKNELLQELTAANSCFINKNNINFSVPTGGQTGLQVARKVTTVGLGALGVIAGVGAATVAIVTTGPVGAAGTALAVTALGAGLSSLSMTVANSANNFLHFRVPPSTGEKFTFAIAGISLGVGVGAGFASAVTAGNQVAAYAIAGGKQVFDSTKTGIAITGQVKTIKSIPASEKTAKSCSPLASSQDQLKQQLGDAKQNDVQENAPLLDDNGPAVKPG